MFERNTLKPVREVLHWVEQAFFAFVLLTGLGLGFYAVVSPEGPRLPVDAAIPLVEIEPAQDTQIARLPSFNFHPAS